MTPAERVAQLSDAELVALTAGADEWTTVAVPRLGIPALRLGDGPHGVRKPREGSGLSMFDSHPATCFPTAAALGSSWDPALVRRVGEALGREAIAHGVEVLLGPGVNLKRTPVGGRNFEYFAEDPLVAGRLGAAWVGGVQSTGVGASLKHFAANNTESRRYGVDSVVDERALRELYLAAFERIVIDEQPATVMAAYNRLNGVHCTENAWLLTRVLREEWGFEGVVVSDWGATWDRTLSVPAGADLAMPGFGAGDDAYVLGAVRRGRMSRAALEASARRILGLVERYSAVAADPGPEPDLEAHHALAREAAIAGTVLLQNDGLLPLDAGAVASGGVAVIGAFAESPRFQGAGSSHVVPTRVDTLLEALRARLGAGAVRYTAGYERDGDLLTETGLADAVAAARSRAVAVLVVGLPETFETEGVDRAHLRLPAAHERLVEAVVAANPRTVVVLQNGSPVELPWRDRVPAVVEGYLGGQAGGSALAAVLLGEAEPGGRLAETFPLTYADHPVSRLVNGPATAEYRESVYLGYRYFDSARAAVAFPFGHGLSYTTFSWSDAVVAVDAADAAQPLVTVALTVTNTGTRAGSEVVQLYLHDVESAVFRPEQELRDFAKVTLEPGGTQDVVLRLDARAFSWWDAAAGAWRLEPGRFELRLGRSSRDILWRETIEVGEGMASIGVGAGVGTDAGVAADAGPDAGPDPYRAPGPWFGAGAFERLLGRPLPLNRAARPGAFTVDTALREMAGTVLGRAFVRLLDREAVKTIGAPPGAGVEEVARAVVAQLNFRMLPTVSAGRLNRRRTVWLLWAINLLAWTDRRRH